MEQTSKKSAQNQQQQTKMILSTSLTFSLRQNDFGKLTEHLPLSFVVISLELVVK